MKHLVDFNEKRLLKVPIRVSILVPQINDLLVEVCEVRCVLGVQLHQDQLHFIFGVDLWIEIE